MDPNLYLPYSPPNGLPQESKLATYMNRSTSTPTRPLNQALGGLSMESSPTDGNKQVRIGEFVPVNYYSPTTILPESPESSPPSTLSVIPNTQVLQENVGGTTYFYSTNSDSVNTSTASLGADSCIVPLMGIPSPYASHMYSIVPTQMSGMAQPGLAASYYSPETLNAELYERTQDIFRQIDLRQYPDLPDLVEMYSNLTPLENAVPHAMTSSFRVTDRRTALHYAMRRLHGHALPSSKRLDVWKQVDHPNVVRLNEVFFTKAFGDHSTVLVYDYHPACATLMSKFLAGKGPVNPDTPTYRDPFSDPDAPRPYTHQKNVLLRALTSGALLPEEVLWSILVQLTAALRAIHSAGLACRTLDPTKVVMNGCRVRIAWCGIADALHPSNGDIGQAQQDDLTALGRLALALAVRTIHCDNLPVSIDLVARSYSPDLKNFILYLLSNSPARRSVTDLMPMIGARFYTQVEALQRRSDAFEDQLAGEIDNGRLLRLLVKLGLINERPELNLDPSWSETGDRYMLKLFRDYLFHSVTEDGRPWCDQAHLTYCLNQLDAGTPAKVELMSRDEQSVLVVTYMELKHCLEQAFDEVMQAAAVPS